MWDDAEGPLGPSDDRFLARLVADYDAATQSFLAAGATDVLWVLAPMPALPLNAATAASLEPLRHAALRGGARTRSPLGTLARRASSISPPGCAAQQVRPSGPDGLHWSPEAAAVIAADFLGPVVDGGGRVMTPNRPCRPDSSSAGSTRRTSGTRSSSSAAARRCERLAVFVNSSRARDAAPGELRAAWLAELHPEVTVVEVVHDLPTDFGDEALWQRWIDLFRAHWPFDADRTSCAPATPTSPNWPGASAPSQSSSTPSGRTCRSARP